MSGWNPDPRCLFTRVVDDIVAQIRQRRLRPGQRLPSTRKLAEFYGVAAMTAQRAMRELHVRGATYGVVGRGTFVRPDALRRLTATSSRSSCARCEQESSYTAHLAAALGRCHQLADRFDVQPSPLMAWAAAEVRRLASDLAGDLMDHAGDVDSSGASHWHH